MMSGPFSCKKGKKKRSGVEERKKSSRVRSFQTFLLGQKDTEFC